MGPINEEVAIPVIDLSPFFSHDRSRESCDPIIANVRSACQNYGFFQLTGHGIPLNLQAEVLLCAKRLFDLPLEQKEAMAMSKSLGMSGRGYESIGGQVLDAKPDTKEGFYIGVEVPATDPRAGQFLQGPNFWPNLPEELFRKPVMEYHKRVLELHGIIIEILAAGLMESGTVLREFTNEPVANLKLLHYPPNASTEHFEEISIGAGAHTDFGCTTILLQQPNQHGLQVWYPPTSTWLPVPAREDVFIVNIGDLLQKWTRGEYKSALHRVINISVTDRYSVPLFYHGNLSTKLRPFNWTAADGDTEAQTVEEHIKEKFTKSFQNNEGKGPVNEILVN